MLHRTVLALAALVLLGGIATAGAAPPHQTFVAHLSGGEEVPPVDTDGRGQALLRLNPQGNALDFKLIVANIDDVTQAHIHCGARGVNGPVVVFLFGFVADGVTTNGILSQGTAVPGDVMPVPASPECPGGVANFDELLAKMRSGDAYVNVHTLDNPPGEIRGQVRAVGVGGRP